MRNRIPHNGQCMWAVSLGWNWPCFPLNRWRDNVVERKPVRLPNQVER
jgi:hypothetical protein